ncbi:MAG: polyprenyl synthetase family protein [Actinobacteria bacterium]|nr:polyprenyl synthetase family protein [Actinomycetota bacterium]MBM3712671.1 polyprenyl synthetase family protein [Actinomycetota bacterium]
MNRSLLLDSPNLSFLKNDLKKLEKFLKDFTENLEGILYETVRNTLTAGGKRIRPSLFLICARNEKYDIEYLLPAAASIEIIHTASLIHDDIIDKSVLRRGKNTIHYIYNKDTAKFVGDYLFTHAFSLLNSYSNPRILEEMSDAAQLLVKGEFDQLKTKKDFYQSEKVYFEKIYEKTSSLFRLSCVLGGILSESGEEDIESMKKFGEYVGISFQINDDLLDICVDGTKAGAGKTIWNDFRQGNITLPFIYGFKESEFQSFIKPFLNKKSYSEKEIEKILNLLSKTNALRTTKNKVYYYLSKARRIINKISGEERKEGLKRVCDSILQVTKLV